MCMIRGGILGVRCGEILLIFSYTLPALGRVSTKNINKLTDLNAAISSPVYDFYVFKKVGALKVSNL